MEGARPSAHRVHHDDVPPRAGVCSADFAFAKWLADRGHDVRVITAFPNYPMGRIYDGYTTRLWLWETMDGVRVLRVPIYPSHDTSAMRRIWTYFSFGLSAATIGAALIGPADVTYLYDPPPTNGIAALLLKLIHGAPVVHHVADLWPESVTESGMIPPGRVRSLVGGILDAYCRFLYRHSSAITTLSPACARMLMERGVPPEKLHVVRNWADEDTFHPTARDEALADELGFTGRFNFVYAGNLGHFQGLDTVIRAAAMVRDDPRIQVALIGTGPVEAQLKALAAELGATNVRFFARRQFWEMPKINAVADVLLIHVKDLAFIAMTSPSKIQVALASGRPVLAGVAGDSATVVSASGAGLVCPPEQPAAMAAAMRSLANESPERLAEMARSGRAYYLSELSLDAAGARMDEIFPRGRRRGGQARGNTPRRQRTERAGSTP